MGLAISEIIDIVSSVLSVVQKLLEFAITAHKFLRARKSPVSDA